MSENELPAWRVLLVDDDEDDYLITRTMLMHAQARKISMDWAATYSEALRLLKADGYDAVLVDYDLGAENGITLIRRVAAQQPALPLILFTGRGSYDMDLEAMQAGATLYLTKAEANPLLLERAIRYAIERKQTEQALRDSEQRYRMLFNTMLNGFALHEILCDETGRPVDYRFLEVNPGFEQLTGLRSADILGKTVLEVLPDTEPYWIETYGQVALTGNSVQFERYNQTLDRHFGVVAFCPRPGQFAVIFTDITQRKQMDAALRESEERYRSLFHNHHTVMLLIDPQTGAIVDANPAACRYYGYPVETLTRMTITQINTLAPDQVRAEMQHATSELRNYFQFHHRLANGTVRDVEVYSGPIHVGGKQLLYSIVYDVTERRQKEQQIKQLSLLPSENPNPVMRIDVDGVLLYANKASALLLNDWHCEAGQKVPDLWREHVWETATSNKSLEVETESWGRVFSFILQPIPEEGYVNLYGRDVTEHRQAEMERERLLHELETERVRWKATVESMLDPVTICDAQGHAIYMNPIYSQHVQRLIEPGLPLEDYARHYALYRIDGTLFDVNELPLQKAAFTGEEVHNQELLQYSSNGTAYISVWNAAPLRDSEGEVIGAVAVGHDVTEQRRAEQKLARHLDRLQKLIQISILILEEETREGLYEKIAARAKELTGVELSNADLFRHPAWLGLLDSGAASAWENTLGVEAGSAALAEQTSGTFEPEDAAILTQLFAMGSLRLQQLQARNEAERRADELDAVINSMSDAVTIYDAQGKLLRLNPAAVTAYGYNPLGNHRLEVARKLEYRHPDGRRYTEEEMPSTRALEGQTVSNARVLFTYPSGKQAAILASAAPVRVNNQLTGAVVVFRDVTQWENTQAALHDYASRMERANRELQDFASIASHDLQEPLRKVEAFARRLRELAEPALDVEALDILNRIQSAAERMQRMITGLLALSQVTTQAQPYEQVDLNQAAAQAVSDLEVRIEREGGKVQIGKLPSLSADPQQMYQLFLNLIGNGLKFHLPGEPPRVSVEGRWLPGDESDHHGWVEIRVKDEGVGFDPAHRERIFQPFQRLNRRDEFEGSGIGLSICRKIVERHGGSITAESQPGKGSAFVVRLPTVQEKAG